MKKKEEPEVKKSEDWQANYFYQYDQTAEKREEFLYSGNEDNEFTAPRKKEEPWYTKDPKEDLNTAYAKPRKPVLVWDKRLV